MRLATPGLARLRIGLGRQSERLPDCSADCRGIGSDPVEPAACLARARSCAAAHCRDHSLQLVNGADTAFDLAELAAHDALAC